MFLRFRCPRQVQSGARPLQESAARARRRSAISSRSGAGAAGRKAPLQFIHCWSSQCVDLRFSCLFVAFSEPWLSVPGIELHRKLSTSLCIVLYREIVFCLVPAKVMVLLYHGIAASATRHSLSIAIVYTFQMFRTSTPASIEICVTSAVLHFLMPTWREG